MSVYFIAGAGTDVGKTYVTALLIRCLRAAGRPVVALKPVASGAPPIDDPAFAETDTAVLLRASGLEATAGAVDACSPWRFAAPLSPDMAAAAEGRTLSFKAVAAWCRDRIAAAPADAVVLIEGVGGVMSPLTRDAVNLDLIKSLACPVILVTGSYLGALSHALTALETLTAHRAAVKAVILNETAQSNVDFEATAESLRRFAPDFAIDTLRRGASGLDLDLP